MTKRKSIKSTFDQFGPLIGKFGSILQSATVKAGNSLEKIIEDELIENNFEDLTSMFNITIEPQNKKKLFVSFKNINFDNKKKYYIKKLSFLNKDNKITEVDLLLFYKNTFYMYEIKSSPQIDSKKAEQEINTLFEATKILQKSIFDNNLNYCVEPSFLFFDAIDKQEVISAFHGKIVENSILNIVKDFSQKYKKQFNKKSLFKYLINKNDDEINLLRPHYFNLLTNVDFAKKFNLDNKNLVNKRKEKIKSILEETIEKSLKDESPEVVKGVISAFESLNFNYKIKDKNKIN